MIKNYFLKILSLIILAFILINFVNSEQALKSNEQKLKEFTKIQFDNQQQNKQIPIPQTIIYVPPINDQYRAVQIIYPKNNNKFEKKVDKDKFAIQLIDQRFRQQNQKQRQQKQKQSVNNQKKQEVDENSNQNAHDQKNIPVIDRNSQIKSGQSKKINENNNIQQNEIKFIVNKPYSYLPIINTQYDITKQIYQKQTKNSNAAQGSQRFKKALSTDWFVNKILKRKQVQQSNKQKLKQINQNQNNNLRKQEEQNKQKQKIQHNVQIEKQIAINNKNLISSNHQIKWKSDKSYQPKDIHVYDKNQNVFIIKKDGSSSLIAEKPIQQKVINTPSPHNLASTNNNNNNLNGLFVNNKNDLPLMNPTKKDLQPVQGSSKYIIPQKLTGVNQVQKSLFSFDINSRLKNSNPSNIKVDNIEQNNQQINWNEREKQIFIGLFFLSMIILVCAGNKQRQNSKQRKKRQQYKAVIQENRQSSQLIQKVGQDDSDDQQQQEQEQQQQEQQQQQKNEQNAYKAKVMKKQKNQKGINVINAQLV